MTKMVGAGMIALGTANPMMFGSLIVPGGTVQKVGITVETVGNYGKMAASVTKTAVYAAQGNIAGALTSAGAAVMSGTSAVKGTKEIKSGFENIDKQVAAAQDKATAKMDAKAADKAGQASAKSAEADNLRAGTKTQMGL